MKEYQRVVKLEDEDHVRFFHPTRFRRRRW